MKNTQKLVAAILASLVLVSNTSMLSAYATENTTLNEQSQTNEEVSNVNASNANSIDLNSLKLDKKDVKPGDNVKVSLKASGVSFIYLQYTSSVSTNVKYLDLHYNSETDLYEGTLNIDDYMLNGTWSLETVVYAYYGENTERINSTDHDFSNMNFNVKNDNADVTAPTIDLDSLKISKNDVQGGDAVQISFKASDDKSGINAISLQYSCPLSSNTVDLDLYLNPETNLYEGTIWIDPHMETGTWSINYINLTDNCSNSSKITSSDYDLSKVSLNVDNSNVDITAPVIDVDSLNVDKKEVGSNDSVKISAKASDDKSGVDYIYVQYVSSNPSHNKYTYLYYNAETNLYEGTIDVDTYMASGTWSIDFISVVDKAGNSNSINPSDYDLSSISFNVNNENEDITAPVIDVNSLNVDKKEVQAGDTVKMSLKASDDKSGVKSILAVYRASRTFDSNYVSLDYNPESGLYEGTIYLYDYMKNNTWSLETISFADNAHNGDSIDSSSYDFSNATFVCK